MDKVAIVAHFDVNNRVEVNFVDLLNCLSENFDRTVLVTTSNIGADLAERFPKVTIIRRPNFGYDFYSYRVGLAYALENWEVGCALLVNSSIALLSRKLFNGTLSRMLDLGSAYDVVGSTESYQFSWHLQSYLILLGSKILREPWFGNFLNSVEPTRSKFDTIQKFELGLSSLFKTNNSKVVALLQPTPAQIEFATHGLNAGGKQRYTARSTTISSAVSLTQRFNPVHHLAELVARELGYVKLELLRENPHQIDLTFVGELCEPERLDAIEEMVSRSRANYTRGSDSLSTLKTSSRPIPVTKLARWRQSVAVEVGVAVILHLYYVEMIADIRRLLENIVLPFDLYVTTPFEGDTAEIFSSFSMLAKSVSVYCTENRGRDIGPFVAVYRSGALDRYDAVLKIHSKKSTYSANGVYWRDRLYRSIAGDSLTVLRSIELIKSGEVGIVGPHSYYLTNDRFWGANRDTMRRLLEEMAAVDREANFELGFFAGSMFWFAPQALAPLKNIPEASLTFEAEGGQQDGTLAHAIERMFCPIARSQGFTASSVILRGKDIQGYLSIENDVPVL
ncbi:rhamnan synthesis F family protein [Mesorhizobium sp.]|uniref:rhamnan synthesis F family protein n=1 Tax=Mesorhizobium sp. TaxID=1871066 RepID=UPI00121FB266|nr:rhamnan synthesis F family protein [Mesorhizobium sp.]TIS89694.1 MAG: hypothetical protein E5W89_14250 [Mesorhizobium sp.]